MAYLTGLNLVACGFDSHPLYRAMGVSVPLSPFGRSAIRRCRLPAKELAFDRASGFDSPAYLYRLAAVRPAMNWSEIRQLSPDGPPLPGLLGRARPPRCLHSSIW